MDREKLTPQDLEQKLQDLPEWQQEHGKLHREYRFADFTHAFGFMAAAATVIEKMDHHPDWCNVYGTVRVELWTHDAGGITSMDTRLAMALDRIAKKLL